MKIHKPTFEKLSIVIPCFNEEEMIPHFIKEMDKVKRELMNSYQIKVEFIFVDDGSRDKTLEVLKEFSQKNKDIYYISLSRNFGKESAMYAGFKSARGDLIAVMDVDLQDPPEYLIKMCNILFKGEYECVATRRVTREGEPLIRSYFAKQFYKIVNMLSDVRIAEGARDFRMMTRKYLDALISLGEYNRFSKGLFSWVGFKTKWLEYENRDRKIGVSKWSFFKLFNYGIDGIVNFSVVPLYALSVFGIALCLLSFGFLIFIIIQRVVFKSSVDGWTSLASLIIFLGGSTIFSLGVIGQYIARIYSEVKSRPIYLIGETNITE